MDIVRQNVLSLHLQPMTLSQLRCGTKLDFLKLLNIVSQEDATLQSAKLHIGQRVTLWWDI